MAQEMLCLLDCSPPLELSEQDDRWLALSRTSQQPTEVCVSRHQDAPVGLRPRQHRDIIGTRHAQIADVMACLSQEFRQERGEVLVYQEPHAEGRSGNCRSRSASAAK